MPYLDTGMAKSFLQLRDETRDGPVLNEFLGTLAAGLGIYGGIQAGKKLGRWGASKLLGQNGPELYLNGDLEKLSKSIGPVIDAWRKQKGMERYADRLEQSFRDLSVTYRQACRARGMENAPREIGLGRPMAPRPQKSVAEPASYGAGSKARYAGQLWTIAGKMGDTVVLTNDHGMQLHVPAAKVMRTQKGPFSFTQ